MAKIETLVDDFSAGSINGTTWPTVQSGVLLSSGRIQITDSTGAYPSIISATTYDATSSYLMAQITAATVTGAGSGPQQTYFGLYKDVNNTVGVAMGDTHLYWYKKVAGTETDTAIGTYNATTMAWWRIRDDGTGLLFGYSSDGVTWTETARQTRPFTMTAVGAFFSVGRYAAGTNPVGYMDNVNVLASTPKSDADTGSGTDSTGTVVQQYTGTDTGSGADSTGTVVQKYTGADTGSGADSSGSLAAALSGSDTSTGADSAGTAVQQYTGSDTATGTDSAGTVVITQTVFDSDTMTGTDSSGVIVSETLAGSDTGIGTDAVAARTASGADTGTGADSAGSVTAHPTGADTATGTDSSGNLTQPKADSDTATAVDADHLSRPVSTTGDTVAATDAVSGKTSRDNDARTFVDAGGLVAATMKTGADTVHGTDAGTALMPGSFTQIPSPKTWSNGDDLDAGTLNKEWRDTFNWLLRATSPAISVYNGDGASITFTNNVAIPLKVEEFKRGNVTHATNDTKIYVWETGWYLAFAQVGANYTSVTADGLKPAVVVKVNGTTAARGQTTRTTNTASMMEIQASLYLNAGDYVELALGNDWTGTLIGYTLQYGYPFLSLFWRSN